jgi:hypothetical protein
VNNGAIVFEIDEFGNIVLDPPITGDPVVVAGPTDPICLAAVNDPEGTLENAEPSRSAAADHDDDGIASLAEACTAVVRTDPCLIDSDGDGDNDDLDNCPLIANGDQADGDFDGVGAACDPNDADDQAPNDVVAQCADGIDNDDDGAIDHFTSALSTNGGDNQCSSAIDNDESA